MKMKYVHFVRFPIKGNDTHKIGHYYTAYNPETGEGHGWFGGPESVEYRFREELRFNPQSGREELMQQTCGVGQGCFWTEWR